MLIKRKTQYTMMIKLNINQAVRVVKTTIKTLLYLLKSEVKK